MNRSRGGGSSGMDLRTILAFAIMILLWVVFSRYFMPRPPEQAKPPQTAEAPVGTAPRPGPSASADDAAATSASGPSAGATAVSGGPVWQLANRLSASGDEVVVETALYRAVFNPRGAVLTSWKLQKYSDSAGRPADLIADPETGALGIAIQGPDGVLDLGATEFTLESPPPGADGQVREIRFVAEGVPLQSAPAASWAATAVTVAESTSQRPPVRIERIYRLNPQRYEMTMEIRVNGISNLRQDHRLILGWEQGLPFLEKQRKQEQSGKAAMALLAEQFIKYDFGGGSFGCGCSGGPARQGGRREFEGMLRWAGVRTKYFTALLVPEQEQPAHVTAISDPHAGEVGLSLSLPMMDEGGTDQSFTVYAGPLDYRIIRGFEQEVQRDVTRIVDLGGKLIAPISKAAHWFLILAHSIVPNFGVAIILLAVVLRLVFHPLTIKSLRSQRKLQMLKPELDKLNEQYKDSPELRAKKTMEFHKKHGVSPLSGCLPLLVQMPVIYALYALLMNAIELRKAPFALWINDLAAPDRVGEIASIPIHILPLLMAVTMFWQQKMTPTDPRQAPMLLLMPVLMVFIFYNLPSGLVLYWTVTNLLTMGQQMAMKPEQIMKDEPTVAAEARPTRRGRSRTRP